jgi:hypothetical protein
MTAEGERKERTHCQNGELLLMFAGKLETLGLDVHVVTYRGDTHGDAENVEELVVTNPAAPGRGEIRVGDDASLTWEYWSSLDEAGASEILETITKLLIAPGASTPR